MCGDPERNALLRRRLTKTTISTGLPADAIEKNPFTVELLEGPDSKVAVIGQVAHMQRIAEHPFHHRSGGG